MLDSHIMRNPCLMVLTERNVCIHEKAPNLWFVPLNLSHNHYSLAGEATHAGSVPRPHPFLSPNSAKSGRLLLPCCLLVAAGKFVVEVAELRKSQVVVSALNHGPEKSQNVGRIPGNVSWAPVKYLLDAESLVVQTEAKEVFQIPHEEVGVRGTLPRHELVPAGPAERQATLPPDAKHAKPVRA